MSPAERLALAIFRRFPPRSTIFLDPEPRPETEYEDERRFGFHRYFGRDESFFLDRDILDLGCGFGGRPVRMAELGASSVAGVEVSPQMVEHARRFAAKRRAEIDFVVGTGEQLPFAASTFDLICMNDVMEHVVDPGRVLAECHRVLRPGGRVALAFPPYYDITGGSHLHGYATRFPGLNLLLPTRTLKAAARRRLQEQGIDPRPWFREVPTDKLWNQNGLTVRGFLRLVERSPLSAEQIWFLGHRDHRLMDHQGAARWLRRVVFAPFELAARVPPIREVACLRICAVLQRT